uniref:Uncharacterized protein n=1 Tax=Arcella intermedia TaxID=1963864 RepID=A0A6B2LMV9_9EUKA
MVFKVGLIGDADVGKTSLWVRLVENRWVDQPPIVENGNVHITVMDRPVKIILCDTASQERFRTISSSAYRGCSGFLICFDVSNRESFSSILGHLREIERYGGDNVDKFLVGCKSDLESNRVINYEETSDLSSELEIDYIFTSAKTGEFVQEALIVLVEAILKRKQL